jgi:anti-sigma B factor antagonist
MTEQEWMEIRQRPAGEIVIIDVIGRMVLTEGEIDSLLRDHVSDLITHDHRQIVVNLSQVTQVDTSGLKQLLAAHLAVTRLGGHLLLANPTKRIRDLLGITRLNTLFEIFETEQAAIDSFAARSNLKT